MSPERVSLRRLWALMATVFVDMVGFLMVLPLLPFYATRLGASPFLVGAMVSAFAVAQLGTSPLWGRLSDRRGRRPMLLVGIAVSIASYLLFAFACSETAMGWMSPPQLLALLFLSRLVQGAGGATTGVVQAYVGDAVVAEERAKALGWITAATSAGVMLGPAIGSLASTLGPAAPGLAATVLCLANLAFAWRWLPESSSRESREQAAGGERKSLRGQMLAVAMHPGRPGSRLILGPVVRRIGEVGALRVGLGALVAGFALQAVAPSVPLFLLVIVLVPIGTALLFPATTSLVTRFAGRHELGSTMGVQQAFGGVARLVGPLWAGAAFQSLGASSPLWISSALAAGTLVFAAGLTPPARAAVAAVAPAPEAAAAARPSEGSA